MEEKERYDLTQGVIWKKLLIFFLPIAVGTVFQQFYNTVDAVVVGKFVGTEALAAVGGSAAQIIALTVGFFVALTGGASAVISQLVGARQKERTSQAIHSSLAFSILAGLGLTVIGIPLTTVVLNWMQTPADTMADSVLYLRIYFGGTVFMLFFNMGSSILRAMGDSKRPLYYLVACCVCNIVLDLVFVIGLHMGIAGVAWATVISQAISSGLILWRMCTTREEYQVELRKLRMHKDVMKRMLKIGMPAGVQASMYNVANLIIQIGINTLSTTVVASWTMSGKVDGIYNALSSAFGLAVMSFVGQNYGAGRLDRVKQTFRVSMVISMTFTVAIEGVVLLLSEYGLPYLIDDMAVVECTREILMFFVPFYVVWTFIEVISGLLRGIGDVLIPMIITAVGICALRLVWMGTVFRQWHTIAGFSMCFPISWLVTAAALTIYYRRSRYMRGESVRL